MQTDVVEFFANHLIDAPVFAQDILAINYDPPQPPLDESNSLNEDDDANKGIYDVNE